MVMTTWYNLILPPVHTQNFSMLVTLMLITFGPDSITKKKHIYYCTSGCSEILESMNLVTHKLNKVKIPECVFSIAYDATSGKGYAVTNGSKDIYSVLFEFDPDIGNFTKIVDMPKIMSNIGVATFIPTINSYVFTTTDANDLVIVNVKTKHYQQLKLDCYIVCLQYDYITKTLYAMNRDTNDALAVINLDIASGNYKYVIHINGTEGDIIASDAYDSVNHVWYLAMLDFLAVVNIDQQTIDVADWQLGLYVEDLQVDSNLPSLLNN